MRKISNVSNITNTVFWIWVNKEGEGSHQCQNPCRRHEHVITQPHVPFCSASYLTWSVCSHLPYGWGWRCHGAEGSRGWKRRQFGMSPECTADSMIYICVHITLQKADDFCSGRYVNGELMCDIPAYICSCTMCHAFNKCKTHKFIKLRIICQ